MVFMCLTIKWLVKITTKHNFNNIKVVFATGLY